MAINGDLILRVTAAHRDLYELQGEAGTGEGRLKMGVFASRAPSDRPTTGDYVRAARLDADNFLITDVLPRRSFFARRDPSVSRDRGMQVVAANFDTVFLLLSMNRDFNENRLDRYLTLAWQSGGLPIILLSKADLCADRDKYLSVCARVAPGVEVFCASALTGEGVEAVRARMPAGETSVFLGSSGVGKSSMVNALAGADIMRVNEIRESDARGRHTTTHRQMLTLPWGATVIDTPGMREMGMWDVTEGLGEAFADVESFAAGCRFRDCRHESEPGCAVRAAIRAGELDAERLLRYAQLRREAKYVSDPAGAAQERMRRVKELSRIAQMRGKKR